MHLASDKEVDSATDGQCEKSEGYYGEGIKVHAIPFAERREQLSLKILEHLIYTKNI